MVRSLNLLQNVGKFDNVNAGAALTAPSTDQR